MNLEYRFVFLFFLVPHCVCSSGQCPNLKTDIKSIRKRRYLVFPDSSQVILTIDLAKTFMTHVPSGWYVTMDLDVLFPLPDKDFVSAQLRKKLHHRQKREFWERLKNAFTLHNINGHACVLRSICEARTHLAPPGKSLVHDILRAIFTAPVDNEQFMEEMGEHYNDLSDPEFCERINECPFSILNFVLAFNKRKK